MMKNKKLLQPTEEYVVKFWVTNQTTLFREQREESAFFYSKGKHRQAENEIIMKYRMIGQKIDVISVIYQ